MTEAITPFILDIPETQLDDLKRRLDATRWPERETVGDWSQGAPLAKVRALCDHWRHRYDWRRCEARLNGFGQFKTEIDGLGFHFLHVRSPEPNALPLVITHGWPGSVIEFTKVIGPLTDPAAHGGSAADAFHVVAPSLPGYGFSDKPAETGWGLSRIAGAWTTLMGRLGYDRWVAQGGDWGAGVTTAIGLAKPKGCIAVHVNMPMARPTPEEAANPTAAEKAALEAMAHYRDAESGYAKQQSTRPQTLGYGLLDSPVGQAAWIYEKMWAWTDNEGAPEDALGVDEMLDNIMLYWLPGAAASSARLYWESLGAMREAKLELPAGVSLYPKEIIRASRRWAERTMTNIIHWNELPRGGHFAAWEEPDLFVQELRDCFRKVR
ncbi:MAG: epoxide hydrolase [Caulobacteraceae bacterium]|nr:epoxide hydrolase [Caulobacteraceae bacterium]